MKIMAESSRRGRPSVLAPRPISAGLPATVGESRQGPQWQMPYRSWNFSETPAEQGSKEREERKSAGERS